MSKVDYMNEFKNTKLPSEDEIISSWAKRNEDIKVSIACITYNHEQFIKDAIKGFLIQKTNFPFEIIIHDDASTDRTSDIIRSYQEKYPSIIKSIIQTENQFSKNIKPSSFIYPICRGKYIAVCEGDDFWCDVKKIQRQADFLDKNPDIFITSFDAFIIDENNNIISESKLPEKYKKDFTAQEMMEGKAWLLTLNWMRRNIDLEDIPERAKVLNGDAFMTSVFGQFGGCHYHTNILPSAYRSHLKGIWSSKDEHARDISHMNTWLWLYQFWLRKNNKQVASIYWKRLVRLTIKNTNLFVLIKQIVFVLISSIGRK